VRFLELQGLIIAEEGTEVVILKVGMLEVGKEQLAITMDPLELLFEVLLDIPLEVGLKVDMLEVINQLGASIEALTGASIEEPALDTTDFASLSHCLHFPHTTAV
jgi:hypothetical protein